MSELKNKTEFQKFLNDYNGYLIGNQLEFNYNYVGLMTSKTVPEEVLTFLQPSLITNGNRSERSEMSHILNFLEENCEHVWGVFFTKRDLRKTPQTVEKLQVMGKIPHALQPYLQEVGLQVFFEDERERMLFELCMANEKLFEPIVPEKSTEDIGTFLGSKPGVYTSIQTIGRGLRGSVLDTEYYDESIIIPQGLLDQIKVQDFLNSKAIFKGKPRK